MSASEAETYDERRSRVLEQFRRVTPRRHDEPSPADADEWVQVSEQDPEPGEPVIRWIGRRVWRAHHALLRPLDDKARVYAEAVFSGKVELTVDLIDELDAIMGAGPPPLLPIKAVAFDAYGTLVSIGDKRAPYARLLARAGLNPAPSPMTTGMDLAATAELAGVDLPSSELADLEADLAAELASVRPFPETGDMLRAVRYQGLKVAVASNLALPYAAPLRSLLGDLVDVWCLSFQVGAVKPSADFYAALCEQLECDPGEVLMVGDTWRCDFSGAAMAGLPALHLDRRRTVSDVQARVSIPDLGGVLTWLDGRQAEGLWA